MQYNNLLTSHLIHLNKGYKLRTTRTYDHKPLSYIQIPFENCVGDLMRVFIISDLKISSQSSRQQRRSMITLDDDGETVNNLVSLDINLRHGKLKRDMDDILLHYHITLVDNDMLSVSGSRQQFSDMLHRIIIAMIKIDELGALAMNQIRLTAHQVDDALKHNGTIGKYHFFKDSAGNARVSTPDKPNFCILPPVFFKSNQIGKIIANAINTRNNL